MPEFLYPLPCAGGCRNHLVSRTRIDIKKRLHLFFGGIPVHVHLIKSYQHRYSIYLAGDKNAVKKRKLDLREIQTHGYHRLVQIGRNDMRLPGQIG